MDKLSTVIILSLILAMFITVAVACSQPIEEDVVAEPIQTQSEATYKVIPLITIHDEPVPETEYKPNLAPVETTSSTESETTPEAIAPAGEGTPMTLTASAYCPCIKCCGKTDGITATGTKATAGRTIAVDPRVIPYGSKVIINGNTYIAEDCGGAIKSYKIDVFHNTHKEAQQWGIKTVNAIVFPPQEEITK